MFIKSPYLLTHQYHHSTLPYGFFNSLQNIILYLLHLIQDETLMSNFKPVTIAGRCAKTYRYLYCGGSYVQVEGGVFSICDSGCRERRAHGAMGGLTQTYDR